MSQPISRVLSDAAEARRAAERAVRYAEETARFYHDTYVEQREALRLLSERVRALEEWASA